MQAANSVRFCLFVYNKNDSDKTMTKKTPAEMFLDLFFQYNFRPHHFLENLIPMKSIQEHLRRLLQLVPTSKML